jgi:hypothetical protein
MCCICPCCLQEYIYSFTYGENGVKFEFAAGMNKKGGRYNSAQASTRARHCNVTVNACRPVTSRWNGTRECLLQSQAVTINSMLLHQDAVAAGPWA